MDNNLLSNLEFHHLGLATKKPEVSKKMVEAMGYSISTEVIDTLQNVKAVMCTKPGNPTIEILYANDTPGPVDTILKTQTASFYHVCYVCVNIEITVDAIKKSGLRAIVLSPPKPAIQFNNRRIAFYMIDGFGILELLEG